MSISFTPKTNYTVVTDDLGNAISVNESGQLKTVLDGKVDDSSSNTLLTASETYTGAAINTLDYSLIFITVYSDVPSSIDGLCLQVSSDGVTWRDGDKFTINAGVEKTFSFQTNKKYARIKYINGVLDQTVFDLHIVLKKTNSKPSSHRIKDSISPEDDATLQKAVITAKREDDIFINVGATDSGNLKVANVENGLSIASGNVAGTSFVHKFGQAPDFDTADGEVTIWDGANDSDINQMVYQYSSTADIDSVSSSDAGDIVDLEIQGLDSNFDLNTQTVTLNGQTRVPLSTSLIRVFRMKNVSSTDIVGNVYCYVNTALSGGVPVDTTKVRASINNGNNQTLMAVYTIPNGKTGYMRDWHAATSGGNKASNYILKLKARPFGQVFQLKHTSALSDSASSYIQHKYNEPEVFEGKTDIEMIVEATGTGVTGASVSAGFDIVLIDE